MATTFASGTHVQDIYYMSGWVPEFAEFLTPLETCCRKIWSTTCRHRASRRLPGTITARRRLHPLAPDPLLQHGAPRQAGFDGPPKTWDELKGYAKELTRDGRYGWVLNYGDTAGIGGVASYWMVFLQQAGGKITAMTACPSSTTRRGSRRCS